MERTRPSRRPRAIGLTLIAIAATYACAETTPVDPDPPGNTAPVASAGANQAVSATLPVSVDGSASSDADGDGITYGWTLSAAPASSAAALDDPTTATPSFTPDLPGTYTLQLVVNDGTADSAPDQLTVTAADNTSRQIIGSGGGTITSVDGLVALTVPPGALAAEEEVSMTFVPDVQLSDELAEAGEGGVVYRFQPDGLQFDLPATLTAELPADFNATKDGDETSLTPVMALTFSDGAFSLAGEQRLVVDPETGAITVSADLEHFSFAIWRDLSLRVGESIGTMGLQATPPPIVEVNQLFGVPLIVGTAPFTSPALPQGIAEASWTDRSEAPIETFFGISQGDLAQTSEITDLHLLAVGGWSCDNAPEGVWAVDVEVEVAASDLPFVDAGSLPAAVPFQFHLSSTILCTEAVEPDFSQFGAFGPEGLAFERNNDGSRASGALLVTSTDGIVVSDESGSVRATIGDPAISGGYNRVAGIYGNGFIAAVAQGLRAYIHELDEDIADGNLADPSVLEFPDPALAEGAATGGPQRAVPNISSNATDVIVGGTGESQRVVGVLYGDKNLAFYIPRSIVDGEPGFLPDTELTEAFKTNGGSVFGGESPVSAWVGPNGFDENNPMLVATIDDGIQASELKLVELVNGRAEISTAAVGFIGAEARTVRCLDGICAVTAWGDGVASGSLTFFAWDGQDTFTPISAQAGRKIGIGMIRRGESVLIATPNFEADTYSIVEISLAGEVIDSTARIAPDGCTGPGHILFRSPEEVIITCNTSDQVVSDLHGLGS